MQLQKITPCLWFDNNCEEAVNFYIDLFNEAPNRNAESKIITLKRHEEGINEPGAEELLGKIMTVVFELSGQSFMALDGGPAFKLTEAISLSIDCEDQAEVDYFWNKLTENGGEESQCGWVKDRFGVSWQVTPRILMEYMDDSDSERAKRVLNTMLEMQKIIIEDLDKAYRGE